MGTLENQICCIFKNSRRKEIFSNSSPVVMAVTMLVSLLPFKALADIVPLNFGPNDFLSCNGNTSADYCLAPSLGITVTCTFTSCQILTNTIQTMGSDTPNTPLQGGQIEFDLGFWGSVSAISFITTGLKESARISPEFPDFARPFISLVYTDGTTDQIQFDPLLPVFINAPLGKAIQFFSIWTVQVDPFSIGSIALSTVPILDLSVDELTLSQGGQTILDNDLDGIVDVQSGNPVTVMVGLKGTDLLLQDETVELKVNSQVVQSKTITAGSESSQKLLVVPFVITFKPEEQGLKNITVTVNPAHILSEHSYLNNSKSIQAKVVSNIDLSILAISIIGATVKDNVYYVSADRSYQVRALVEGSGFGELENRSTTLTLQVGSQAVQSKTVQLSEIKVNNGAVEITFDVSFKTNDNNQTTEARINADKVISESDFSNNSIRFNYKILPQYELVIGMNLAQIVSNDPLIVSTRPSNLHCGNGNPDVVTKVVNIRCRDKTTGIFIEGCQYKVVGEYPYDANDGGHDRSNHPPRPTQLNALAFPQTFATIPLQGTTFNYQVPEASGEVDLKFFGTGPNAEVLDVSVIRVRIQTKDLVQIISDNFSFVNLETHSAGIFGTSELNSSIDKMVQYFRDNLIAENALNIPEIHSEGANLPWGGLFDIGEDHITPGWATPHCGHRGSNIDISVSGLTKHEKNMLSSAIFKAKMAMPYQPESPLNPNASHWHLKR